MHQWDVVGIAEQRHHVLGLVLPQQAMIDENAGEAVADRFVDRDRGNRGIDPTGKAADARLSPTCSRIAAMASSRKAAMDQSGVSPATRVGKFRISPAPSGVVHLRVELHSETPLSGVFNHGERRAFGGCDHAPAGGQRRDLVAMGHPDRVVAPLLHSPSNRAQSSVTRTSARPAFVGFAPADRTAGFVHQRLLPVADTEHGQVAGVQARRDRGCFVIEHGGWATAQDHRRRAEVIKPRCISVVGDDFAVEARFTHTPRAISCVTCEPKSMIRTRLDTDEPFFFFVFLA